MDWDMGERISLRRIGNEGKDLGKCPLTGQFSHFPR